MFIEFKTQNFRTFRDEVCLKLRASRSNTHHEALITRESQRFLPSVVIYGANASGKSNLILALETLRALVLQGTVARSKGNCLEHLPLYPFLYGEKGQKPPMKFEIEFVNNDRHYRYSLEIDISFFQEDSYAISFESLFLIGKYSSLCLFERHGTETTIPSTPKLLKTLHIEKKQLDTIMERVNKNFKPTDLFLSRAFNLVCQDISDDIQNFFTDQLLIISDFATGRTSIEIKAEQNSPKTLHIKNNTLEHFFRAADIGTQQIFFQANVDADHATATAELKARYQANEGVESRYTIPAKLMESKGTMKLVDFAILFSGLFSNGGVFVLDEFDASIHPELLKGILALFHDPQMNLAGAQLIFTTHNPIYLNNEIFRQDQILFVEKSPYTYTSNLYTLSDLSSVRNDHNYLINYFKGRYGALPFVDFAEALLVDDEQQDIIEDAETSPQEGGVL